MSNVIIERKFLKVAWSFNNACQHYTKIFWVFNSSIFRFSI